MVFGGGYEKNLNRLVGSLIGRQDARRSKLYNAQTKKHLVHGIVYIFYLSIARLLSRNSSKAETAKSISVSVIGRDKFIIPLLAR